MYLVGFLVAWLWVRRDITREVPDIAERTKELNRLEGLMTYLVLGVIVGGRLGYCIFYNPGYFLQHPLEILATWHGGMSFHGGALGTVLGGFMFCRRHQEPFMKWADKCIVPAPIGLFFGRIANFINGELYGRPTDVPWAMVFPGGGPIPRHPSQIYEAILEGPILLAFLLILRRKRPPRGVLFAAFMAGYGTLRFLVEFFREPDPQLGFILFGWMTMGQILSTLMIIIGLIIFWWYRKAPG